MRKTRTALVVALLGLFAVACGEQSQPTAPNDNAVASSFSLNNGATKGEVVIVAFQDFTDYVSCANDGAGEILHWYGSVRVTARIVTSNSGNELMTFDSFEYLPGYTVTGLTSGDAWTFVSGSQRNASHTLHNGNWVRNTVYVEWYENQDGERMLIQTTVHYTLANDAWRVARIAVTACSHK